MSTSPVQEPRTIAEADAFLREVRESMHLVTAFDTYFPKEFPLAWREDQRALLPQEGQVYSEAELACITRLERLFPFALDHLLWTADDGERCSVIPLDPCGVDCWDRPISDHEPGWQILLLLVQPHEEAGVTLPTEVTGYLAQVMHVDQGLSLDRLDALCQREEPPLCSFSEALRMIDHQTDNAFLDPTYDMPCEDMFWDLDDIALLKRHWEEAKPMITHADALAEWLAADPHHVRKVVELWNQAVQARL